MKKPAHRGATAGLSNAFLAVRDERSSADRPVLQAKHIANRFGVSALHAAVIAELAFPSAETWRGRQ
ncbi:hypothetical protein [Methylobacterium flocculans]|uniref:hypothetical protein n=1 Tax=Methylobacterium flocculans TaxID=2984843 RepID=UPI0021F36584|nr:hypothetical protein [Methylobacterium sp. FF17]